MKNLILIIIALSLFTCCTNHDHKEDEAHSEAENSAEDVVEISEEQMKIAGIELGTFQKRKLKNTVKANGILELPPQNRANISPLMGGTVKEIRVIEGDFVEAGQTLALLQHPQFIQLQQDYMEALNKMTFAEADYTRKKNLYNENISSGKEFQQIEMEFKTSRSMVKALQAKLQLLNLDVQKIEMGEIQAFIPLKSPIHGYVRTVETSIGSYIEPNEEVFEIIDNHHIHIDLLVYENDVSRVKIGQIVSFKVASLANTEHQAKVFAVGKAFEKELKAVRIHAEIENPESTLLPGMYVDARILTDNEESEALPETALHREGESSYIFIQIESTHEEEDVEENHHLSFKKIPVQVGTIDNGFAEVIPFQRLAENTTVVIRGNYYLDSELNKGEAEHHH